MNISTQSSRPKRCRACQLSLGLALGLSACSSEGSNDWSQMYDMLDKAIWTKDTGVPFEQAAAIPYATIGVRVDGGSQGMLVLAMSNPGGEYLWTSAAKIALLTREGRIVRTAGLEHNLSDRRVRSGSHGSPSIRENATSQWEMDFADLNLYSVLVNCQSIVHGPETIKNFNVDVRTIRVDENCRSDQLDWDFVNSYWVSPASGVTWRSVQYVSPKLGPIEISVLRPPAAS